MNALTPQGLGTAEVEGLASYTQRVAAANGTYPGQIVFRYLTWMDRGLAQRVGAWSARPGRVRVGFNINSFALADVWLRLLQRATGRADLLTLTTRAWDDAFPTREFQTATLEWCPLCLQEDRHPYYRVSWTIRAARVCLRHHRRLQRRCARCDKAPPVLHDRSLVAMCPWCAGDLRIPTATDPALALDQFEYWATREIGEIIAKASDCHREVTWRPASALRLLARSHGMNNASALARFLGISKLTAWYWLRKGTRPALGSALRVYFRFRVSLADHLFSPTPSVLPARHSLVSQDDLPLLRRRPARLIDWVSVKKVLRAEIGRPVGQAPTFIAVAQRLDIARRTLRAHAPALCREISRRHRERLRRERDARERNLAGAIRAAAEEMAGRGQRPKWRDIERAMGRPGLFNSRYARAALRRAFGISAGRHPIQLEL
jgi:hypothetical protein